MKRKHNFLILISLFLCACQKQTEVVTEIPGRTELVFEVNFSAELTPEQFEARLTNALKDIGKVREANLAPNLNQEKLEILRGRYTIEIQGTSAEKAAEVKRRLDLAPTSVHIYLASRHTEYKTEYKLPWD